MTPEKKMDNLGIDRLIELVEENTSLAEIANICGCGVSSIRKWVNADESRKARWDNAQEISAQACDDQALQILMGISDNAEHGEIQKAVQVANHLRWRAKAKAPGLYGEKKEVLGAGGITVVIQTGLGKEKVVEGVMEQLSG